MLLGRSRELTRLNDLLLAARQGHSAAVVISGEAGIGKSALAESIAGAAGDTAILRTRGIEAESAIPFAGLADLLRPVQHLLSELPEPQAAALAGALALGPPTAVDRFAVAAATLNLLAVATQGGSLLCVVDDAHWLDPSSAEALIFAARRMRAEGSVLVFTVRDNEPGADRFGVLEQVRLGGLDAESATALLVRGAGRPLPPQVVQRLVADTGGNPLALLELPGQLTEDQLSGRTPILEPLAIIEQRLTRQELQVSLAIQRGLTNADAAAELFLSVKTIEYHLSNIYRKLGINSRTQLIRILGERPSGSVAAAGPSTESNRNGAENRG
jgi:DNA-binding CsgD family transcriptional regulator/predicted ATPase